MQQNQVSRGVRLVIGMLLGTAGLILTVAQVRFDFKTANPWQSTEMAGVLMGLCVMFCGVSISMPPVEGFPQRLFGALTITCMALLFDWVAFVPGPRDFHAGASSLHRGGSVNSGFGRVVFGIAALLMDLFALYAWRVTIRVLRTGLARKREDA
jgi:hypothetical protein